MSSSFSSGAGPARMHVEGRDMSSGQKLTREDNADRDRSTSDEDGEGDS